MRRKSISKLRSSSLALAMYLSFSVNAQGLREAVQLALQRYPTVLATAAKSQAAVHDIDRAKGAHWPQLSWTGTYNAYQSGSVSDYWVQSPMVSLNLWSGRKIESDVHRSKALAEAGRHQMRLTRDDVALLTAEAYLNWAHQGEMVRLALWNVQAHEKILNDFIKITEVDSGRRIDLNQAQVRYDNARLSLTQREADELLSRQRLRRMLMGDLPSEPADLDWVAESGPSSQALALESLNDDHPLIAQLAAQVAAGKAEVQRVRSQYFPAVNLTHGKQTYQGLSQGRYVTQLIVSVPIWDGGSTPAMVAAATANLEANEHNLAEARLFLREKISSQWSDWSSAMHRHITGLAQSDVAQELVQGYWKQFRVGRRSLLDLLNVQSDFYLYQSNATAALYETRLARARMLAAMGRLALACDSTLSQGPGLQVTPGWTTVDLIPGDSEPKKD